MVRDAVGSGCVKDVEDKAVFEEEKVLYTWKAYFKTIFNEDFVWDKHSLSDVDGVKGPSEKISVAEVKAAIAKMKINKASGLSGVV